MNHYYRLDDVFTFDFVQVSIVEELETFENFVHKSLFLIVIINGNSHFISV